MTELPSSIMDITADYLNNILNFKDKISTIHHEAIRERSFILQENWFRVYLTYCSNENSIACTRNKKNRNIDNIENVDNIEDTENTGNIDNLNNLDNIKYIENTESHTPFQRNYIQSSLTKDHSTDSLSSSKVILPTPIVQRTIHKSYDDSEYLNKLDMRDLPKTIAIKISTLSSVNTSENHLMADIFRRECLCFAHFSANGLDKSMTIPYVYYAHFDSYFKYILIIEDCFKSSTNYHSNQILENQEVTNIIKHISKFQSQFWHYVTFTDSNNEEYKWNGLHRGNDDTCLKNMNCKWIPESFSILYHSRFFTRANEWASQHYLSYWARFSKKNLSNLVYNFMREWKLFEDWVEKMKSSKSFHIRRLSRLFGIMKRYSIRETIEKALIESNSLVLPRTIIHGNIRLQNIIIRHDTGNINLLDWYFVSVGNGYIDIIDFLTHCIVFEALQKNSDDYLLLYTQYLSEFGCSLTIKERKIMLQGALWFIGVIIFGYVDYFQCFKTIKDLSSKEFKESVRPIENILFLLNKYAFGEPLISEPEKPKRKKFLLWKRIFK